MNHPEKFSQSPSNWKAHYRYNILAVTILPSPYPRTGDHQNIAPFPLKVQRTLLWLWFLQYRYMAAQKRTDKSDWTKTLHWIFSCGKRMKEKHMTDGSQITHPLLETAPTAYTSRIHIEIADNNPCFSKLCLQSKGCESLNKSCLLVNVCISVLCMSSV